jgi:hypothetical protein
MEIGAITSRTRSEVQSSDGFARTRQFFQELGSALESGNLSVAKEALAQLQKNAPARAGNENNPITAKIQALSKALEAGDLKAAQSAYADIKSQKSQRPTAGRRADHAGGPAPGGTPPSGAGKSSGTGGPSNSTKVYDPKDTNKDGKVSWKEAMDYKLKHPEATTQDATSTNAEGDGTTIDALA